MQVLTSTGDQQTITDIAQYASRMAYFTVGDGISSNDTFEASLSLRRVTELIQSDVHVEAVS